MWESSSKRSASKASNADIETGKFKFVFNNYHNYI